MHGGAGVLRRGAVRACCGATRCGRGAARWSARLEGRHGQGEEEGGEGEEVPDLHELAPGIQQEGVHARDALVQLLHIRLQLLGH